MTMTWCAGTSDNPGNSTNREVVAQAADGKEFKAIETKPDVAVIDYSLPHNETVVDELLRACARGHLLKSDAKTT
jgi:DNA-binding NarL/FixJ family response regulator